MNKPIVGPSTPLFLPDPDEDLELPPIVVLGESSEVVEVDELEAERDSGSDRPRHKKRE